MPFTCFTTWISQTPIARNAQLTVKVLGDCFEIELPNEHIVAFPNHLSLDKITYIRVKGDLKVTSFKFE
ncbi:UNVERIFIED_CONTAM: hypothetical protein FKN15_055779 [Acipenser sinensis]